MKNIYLRVALAVLLFCLVQAVGSVGFLVIYNLVRGLNPADPSIGNSPLPMAMLVMGTGVISCLILICMKMVRFPEAFRCGTVRPQQSAAALLAALLGILALGLISEKLDLPDTTKANLMDMSHNVWGIMAIAVVGPIVEEIYFREGIQGYMLRNGVSPWRAILIASFCFGLIHLNPAQVPFACCIGIILGIVYYKTGNVLLTSLIHILNNSVAVMEMNMLGEDIQSFKYEQVLGGPWNTAYCIIISATCCVLLLRYYWKH